MRCPSPHPDSRAVRQPWMRRQMTTCSLTWATRPVPIVASALSSELSFYKWASQRPAGFCKSSWWAGSQSIEKAGAHAPHTQSFTHPQPDLLIHQGRCSRGVGGMEAKAWRIEEGLERGESEILSGNFAHKKRGPKWIFKNEISFYLLSIEQLGRRENDRGKSWESAVSGKGWVQGHRRKDSPCTDTSEKEGRMCVNVDGFVGEKMGKQVEVFHTWHK